MRLNIKQRFALLFLFSALVPLGFTTIGSFASARVALERLINAELTLVTRQALADLEALLDRMLSDLDTWSGLRVMQDALIDDEAGEIAAELERLRARYPYFASLIAVNSEGAIIASTDHEAERLPASGKIREVIADGEVHRGQIFDRTRRGSPTLTFAVPLRASYDPATIIGALVGVVDWGEVQQRLSTISLAGAMQDEDHALILRSQRDGSVWYHTPAAPGFDLDEAKLRSEGDSRIASTKAGTYLLQNARSAPSPSQDSPQWEIVAAIGTDVAFASIYRVRWQILALVTALSSAALFVARMAANDLVRPIASLITVMKRIADGQSDTPIPAVERNDEIGDMAVALLVFKDQAEERLRLMAEREASAARALDASEERFRDIAEATSDWIWEIDADLCWTYLSEQFVDATGRRREALLGQPWSHVFTIEDTPEEPGQGRPFSERKPVRNLSCSFRGADGKRKHCRVSAKPIFRDDGAFTGYRGATSDVTKEVEAQAKAKHLALHDALTGLPNRILLAERLEHALAGARRSGQAVNVLCMDVDRFKEVNDTLGHPAGDELLRKVAAQLVDNVREMDTVSRLGGDEFVIVQVGASGADDAQSLCQRLQQRFASGFEIDGHHVAPGLSIGIAVAPVDGKKPDDILKKADMALYQAKEEGRGVFRFFKPEMNTRLQERRALERDLRAAVDEDAFYLHYQPQVEAKTGRLVGVEALLRWNHHRRGAVSPVDYIPLAEETGLIHQIGAWVLRRACEDAMAWGGLSIAVNVSPLQFCKGNLAGLVQEVLEETGLAPERLELEITEGVLMHDTETAAATVASLKALGVRVAMDDFGTGYSSLAYMQQFNFDKIKIDRSFTSQLNSSLEAAAIVRAVVSLGRSLDIPIIAEGVETAAQVAFLVSEGCPLAQGFLFGRPISASAIDQLWAREGQREDVASLSDLR